MALGTVDRRHIVRIFFPRLANLGEGVPLQQLTQNQLRALYDKCIRPTVIFLLPGEGGHWPTSYDAEWQRIKRPNGGVLQFGTQQVPDYKVPEFGEELLARIEAFDWGEGAFYGHQIRGARGATQHDYHERCDALAGFLDVLISDMIDDSEWYVDVGIELQSPGQVLWWRKDAFWKILGEILDLGDEEAEAVSRQSKCQEDPACQLTEIGGFRMEVNPRLAGNTGVVYIQAYNTEKTPTYVVHGRMKSKRLDLVDVLKKAETIDTFMASIGDIWNTAQDTFHGHARLEVRLPLRRAGVQLIRMSPENIARYVIALPQSTWW